MMPSTLYKHTVKTITTPGGRQILAIKASAHRTSANGFTGWPTPTTRDWKDGANPDVNVPLNGLLGRVVWLSGWPTTSCNKDRSPREVISQRADGSKNQQRLQDFAAIAGPARLTATGAMLTGLDAGMVNGGRLNQAHSRWLMGLPPVWDSCGDTAMQSLPRKRRRSSRPISK